MVFDFTYSCSNILNETYEELCELGLSIETLVESSVDDVIWFLKLVGGHVILDVSENKNYEGLFLYDLGKNKVCSPKYAASDIQYSLKTLQPSYLLASS